MNEEISKKLIIIRICIAVIGIIFITLSIFLIIKCNFFNFLFSEKKYVREIGFIPPSTKSNAKKTYVEEPKEEKKKVEKSPVKKGKKEEVVDNKPWWWVFKNVVNDKGSSVPEFVSGIKASDDIKVDKKIKNADAIKVQNKFYELHLENNSWHIIDMDGRGKGYNYYFNDKGKLLVDTVTKDYKVVDFMGREVDDELSPIKYKVDTESNIYKIYTVTESKEPSKIIYSPEIEIKEKIKLYDKTMDRNMLNYIVYSNGFKKTTNGTIYNGSKWMGVSSLKDDGSKVVFYNPENNFNKITGIITHQEVTNNDNETRCMLYVYDKEHDNINNDEPIYSTDLFNYNEPYRFSFTFYRSVKNIEFYITTEGQSKKRICYLKNLKFGFDKGAYKEELEEKKEEEDYINKLKKLGIYYEVEEINATKYEEDEYDYYLGEYEFIDYNDVGLIDKGYRSKEDKERDRTTGPSFDTELKNKKQIWEEGPAFDTNNE